MVLSALPQRSLMHLSLDLAAASVLVMSLVACGGGGSDGSAGSGQPNGEDNATATDAQVAAYVKSSNIDFLPNNRPGWDMALVWNPCPEGCCVCASSCYDH